MTREEAIDILEEVKELDDSIYQYNTNYLKALEMAIKALEQESSGDAVSRQAAIVALDDRMSNLENVDMQIAMGFAKGIIYDLPSVKPQEGTGHWIEKGHNLGDDYIDERYCCSECGERALVYEFGTHPVCLSNFCPNCGADMRGDENG